MNDINRQKFLAELGRLLTFMYEEDRQTALAMYGKMFDDTDDEERLIRFLNSPTRQAVVVARTYNARARKLQVEALSRKEDDDAEAPEPTPDFVLAIDEIYRQFFPDQEEAPEVNANQYSLFADGEQPIGDGLDEMYPVLKAEAPQPAEESAPAEPAESPAPAEGEEPVPVDEVDKFLEKFQIGEETPDETGAEAEEPAPEDGPEEGARYLQEEPLVRRKPRVFLLILFILLATPLTIVGIVVLLLPTLLFLGLSAANVVSGAALLIAAFSGFRILADILLLLGCAVVLLALGLLFLWIFIWFIGGVMAGMVSGIISLGAKWCYKEVSE